MKKKISLFIALAVMISSFVSFATVASATMEPEVVFEVTEVTDFTVAPYNTLTDYDWSGYQDEATGEYKTYDIVVKIKGFELSVVKTGGKTPKYQGQSLMNASLTFDVSSTGTYETDFVSSMYQSTLNEVASKRADGEQMAVGDSYSGAKLPAAGTVGTVAKTDEIELFRTIVTVDTAMPVTYDLSYACVTIGDYSTGSTTDAQPGSRPEYKNSNGSFPITGVSLTIPPAEAPTTYTYTFKNIDGTADIDVQSGLAAGATVTAPTAPTVAGKVFDHWSDAVGGAAVVVDATASDNKTYFAVYVDEAPAYETVAPSTAQTAKVAEPGATTYTDYDNKPVTLSKNYAIARFQTGIDGSKTYQIHASSASTATEKDFDVNFGLLEVSGTANFVTIIKGAPADTVMELRVK